MKTYPRVIELFKKDLRGGVTLRGLVRKTGLNSNTVANYLEGMTEPTQASLEKISCAYGKSVAWLRGDTDDTTPQPISDAIDIRTLSPSYALGAGGRTFESFRSDHKIKRLAGFG